MLCQKALTGRRIRTALLSGVVFATAALPAQAMDITTALVTAYKTNPTIEAARDRTRAANEAVREAIGNALPQISASATSEYVTTNSKITGSYNWDGNLAVNAAISLQQTLYAGGAIDGAVQQVEFNTRSQWAGLEATEQQIMNQVAQTYISIVRNEALSGQYNSSLRVLREQLRAAQARFEAGVGTRTEIAQTRARLAQEQANQTGSASSSRTQRATFVQLVGQDVGRVNPPAMPPAMPHSLDEALEAALAFHPSIRQASLGLRAAENNVSISEAANRPTVVFNARGSSGWDEVRYGNLDDTRVDQFRAGVTVSVPLFTGGKNESKIRQAKLGTAEARHQLEAARASVRAQVSSAWNNLTTARSLQRAFSAQRSAASLQLEGAEAELEVGTKTFLDVLTAQQSLIEARTGLVRSSYDEVAAAYNLLAAMGRLDHHTLGFGNIGYHPQPEFEKTKAFFNELARVLPALSPRD